MLRISKHRLYMRPPTIPVIASYYSLGTQFRYSTDNGASWSSVSVNGSYSGHPYYLNNRFVMFGSIGFSFTDDINNWSISLPAAGYSGTLIDVLYANGKYVILYDDAGTLNTYVAYSDSLTSWTQQSVGLSNGEAMAFGDGKFVAIETGTNAARYSSNLTSWSSATLPSTSNWYDLVYGDKFVAIENSIGGTVGAYSSDGITWTASTMPAGQYVAIQYGGGLYLALGNNITAYSSDGISWTAGTTCPVGISKNNLIYNNGVFVALGTAAAPVAASTTDGVTWTTGVTPGTGSVGLAAGKVRPF
jgi:hypothetical protein